MSVSWPRVGNGAYGPDALGTMNQAFDNAWVEIAGNFSDDPQIVEGARNRLADAMFKAAAKEGCADVEHLKRVALRMMALSYLRTRPP